MSGADRVTTSYSTLENTYEQFVDEKTGKTPELTKKLTKAIVDNFVVQSPQSIEDKNADEQEAYKQDLEKKIQEYIEYCLASNPPQEIELKHINNPINVSDWLDNYTQYLSKQGEKAQEIRNLQPEQLTSISQIGFDEHMRIYQNQQKKIKELEGRLLSADQKVTEAQMGHLVNIQGRRVNLGLIDIKYPGKGDRTTRHFKEVQPLYMNYLRKKASLGTDAKVAALREIIEYCSGVFPNADSMKYWFRKGTFRILWIFQNEEEISWRVGSKLTNLLEN